MHGPTTQKLTQPLTRTLICLPLALTAWGGPTSPELDESVNPGELSLIASPPGGEFMYEVEVALFADAKVEIYYTLDGESPMGEHHKLYEEPLLVTDSTLLRFAAKTADGRWTESYEELYSPLPDFSTIKEANRMLRLSAASLYFAARTGEEFLTRDIAIHSVGLEQVTISNIYVSADPDAPTFFNPGIFNLETQIDAEQINLASGESLDLVLSYIPTETLASAALILETDDERVPDGIHIIHLTGRIFDW